jgi:hypothetical protein
MNLSRFPQEEKSLLLAYEESKSIVEYIEPLAKVIK